MCCRTYTICGSGLTAYRFHSWPVYFKVLANNGPLPFVLFGIFHSHLMILGAQQYSNSSTAAVQQCRQGTTQAMNLVGLFPFHCQYNMNCTSRSPRIRTIFSWGWDGTLWVFAPPAVQAAATPNPRASSVQCPPLPGHLPLLPECLSGLMLLFYNNAYHGTMVHTVHQLQPVSATSGDS